MTCRWSRRNDRDEGGGSGRLAARPRLWSGLQPDYRAFADTPLVVNFVPGWRLCRPEGFPPVKPPNYFSGDLLGKGPWKQFWAVVDARAHHFREAVG